MNKLALAMAIVMWLAMPALADTVSFTGFTKSTVEANDCWDAGRTDGLAGLRRACSPAGTIYLNIPVPDLPNAADYQVSVWARKNGTGQTVSCFVHSWSRLNANNYGQGSSDTVSLSSNSSSAQELYMLVPVPAHGVLEAVCTVGQNAHLLDIEYGPY